MRHSMAKRKSGMQSSMVVAGFAAVIGVAVGGCGSSPSLPGCDGRFEPINAVGEGASSDAAMEKAAAGGKRATTQKAGAAEATAYSSRDGNRRQGEDDAARRSR